MNFIDTAGVHKRIKQISGQKIYLSTGYIKFNEVTLSIVKEKILHGINILENYSMIK